MASIHETPMQSTFDSTLPELGFELRDIGTKSQMLSADEILQLLPEFEKLKEYRDQANMLRFKLEELHSRASQYVDLLKNVTEVVRGCPVHWWHVSENTLRLSGLAGPSQHRSAEFYLHATNRKTWGIHLYDYSLPTWNRERELFLGYDFPDRGTCQKIAENWVIDGVKPSDK